MKKMYIIIIAIVILVGGGYLLIKPNDSSLPSHPGVMDQENALRYVSAWADKVNARDDFANLMKNTNGDFSGQVGSLGFEYQAQTKKLIMRAYIFPYDDNFNKPDLLPELNKIAQERPDTVANGNFEFTKGPWETDKEASLFLRLDFSDASMSKSDFLAKLIKLRDDSMVWRRMTLTKTLDSLVKKRRGIK